MTKEIDERMPVSKSLEQNKLIWARLMYKNKNLQAVLSDFTQKIKEIMEKEFQRNQRQLHNFMGKIRPPDWSLGSTKKYVDSVKDQLKNKKKKQPENESQLSEEEEEEQ